MGQFARPDADISATNWTGAYTAIDEVSYDDADYLTGANSANGTCEKGLSNVTDPASSSGHVVRFRAWQENNTHQRTLSVVLVQGSTVISTYAAFDLVKGVATSYSWTLSAGEADSITNYSDLRLRFTSGGTVSTPAPSRSTVYVSWAELEVPNVVYAQAVSGALSTAGTAAKQVGKPVSGGLTLAGVVAASKVSLVSLAGALGLGGVVGKLTGKGVGGELGSSGGLVRSISKTVAGAWQGAGDLLAELVSGGTEYFQDVAGALGLGGLVAKLTGKSTAGEVGTAGDVSKTAEKPLSGELQQAGALSKATGKGVSGSLGSAGGLAKVISKILGGEWQGSGIVQGAKVALMSLAGALGLSGLVSRATGKGVTGEVAPSGEVGKATGKAVGGSLSSAGGLTKAIGKILGGEWQGAGGLTAGLAEAVAGMVLLASKARSWLLYGRVRSRQVRTAARSWQVTTAGRSRVMRTAARSFVLHAVDRTEG